MIFIASISCQTSGNVTARNSGDRKMIRLFELRRVIGQHISSSHLPSHPPPPGETHCTMETQAYITRMFSRSLTLKCLFGFQKFPRVHWAGITRPAAESWTPVRPGQLGGRFLNCFKILRPKIFIQTKIFHWEIDGEMKDVRAPEDVLRLGIIYEDETAERTGHWHGPCLGLGHQHSHNFQNREREREREILITITRAANLIHGWLHVCYLSHTTYY